MYFEETEILQKTLNKAKAIDKEFSPLPRKMHFTDIMIKLLALTAPLIVTIPLLGSVILVSLFGLSDSISKLFTEINGNIYVKNAKSMRRNVIIVFFFMTLATVLFIIMVVKNTKNFETMFASPFGGLVILISGIFTICGIFTVGQFYRLKSDAEPLIDSLSENIDEILAIEQFEKDNESIISKYEQAQEKLKEYTDAHKDVFKDYFKISARLLSRMDDIGSSEWTAEKQRCEEKEKLYRAKYPQEFAEYDEIQKKFDEFSKKEKHIISEHHMKIGTLRSLSNLKERYNFLNEPLIGDYSFGFTPGFAALIVVIYDVPAMIFVLNKIFG